MENEQDASANFVDPSALSKLAEQMTAAGSTFSSLSLPVEAAGGILQSLGSGLSAILQQTAAFAPDLGANELSAPQGTDAETSALQSDETGAGGTAEDEEGEKVKSMWSDVRDHVAKINEDMLNDDASNWLGIIANATSGSKKLQAIHKAAAILQRIRNTAAGITSALAGPPNFPFNFAVAATIAARGAAQLGKVKGQAHDGINNIPSTGTYLLERGERVVDSRLNTDLSGFLKAQNGAAGTSNSIANNTQTSSVTNAPVINLTIGSDADENAVSSNRGAMETMIREIFADYAMDAPFG